MTRHLVAVALLAALPAVASAQVGTQFPYGPPVLGGGLVFGPPITDGVSALFPVQTAVPSRFSVGGGALSGYPQVWLPSGQWGNVYYPWPAYPMYVQPAQLLAPVAAVRGDRNAPNILDISGVQANSFKGLDGQANATLVVEFPAAAEIWVGGKKRDGDPSAEWTLTSPVLNLGATNTFEVKGRWKAGGKTFEASRSVTLTAGERSRSIVVSGTEVKE